MAQQHPIIELDTGLLEPCPYYLGEGILDAFPNYLNSVGYDRLFLITSGVLRRRFGDEFRLALDDAGVSCSVLTIEEGEGHKSWDTLSDLCERLVAAQVTHDSVLVALGGGVISNLVGLAAALIYRGIRYIDVPTTLVAQTDGTVSNKQAINGRAGKNQFGVYHRPLFVWSDVAYVRQEPVRQVKSAIVEGIKNGLIADESWLDELDTTLSGGLDDIYGNLTGFAAALIQSKLTILRRDPTERKDAVILEYGHTCGHAIEWLSHGRLHHGEAVGIGMCVAARLGRALGITPPEVLDRQHHLLKDLLGSPVEVPADLPPQAVYASMLADNKRRGGGMVRFLLLEGLGRPYNPDGDYLVPIPGDLVMQALTRT